MSETTPALAHIEVTDQEILKHFPRDQEKANELLTELARVFVSGQTEGPETYIENRPDWQKVWREGRQQRLSGDVISHEDVLRWHQEHL